jgi:hypothetical protein
MLWAGISLLSHYSDLLYNGYQVSFPGVKQLELVLDHPSPSTVKFKERVELYLYSLLSLHGLF